MSVRDIVARGHDRDLVKRVEHLLYISEYKRRQAAPGVKVTARNFGRDRRYPIVNGFRDQGLVSGDAYDALLPTLPSGRVKPSKTVWGGGRR